MNPQDLTALGAGTIAMQNNGTDNDTLTARCIRTLQRLRRKMRKRRRLFRAWVEMSQDMVFILDRNKKYLFVNEVPRRRWTQRRATWSERRSAISLLRMWRATWRSISTRFLKQASLLSTKYRFCFPPRQIWAYQRMAPVKRDTGEGRCYPHHHDITDRKLAEMRSAKARNGSSR